MPGLEKDVLLKNHTTFRIGGPADFFYWAKSIDKLIKAVKLCCKLDIDFFILAGGSKTLVADTGFRGMVIKCKAQSAKCKIKNLSRVKSRDQDLKIIIEAGAGTKLKDLIQFSVEESLTGLEWAAGIPGTIGGAIRGNAAAFGLSMSDIVDWVRVFNARDFEIKELDKDRCEFSPKHSVFKKDRNLIILSARLRLRQGNQGEMRRRVDQYLKIRKERQPLGFPSAGCIFENFIAPKEFFLKLDRELEQFRKKGIIPSGFLIDRCGLKGKTIGGAQISEKHANFIINKRNARADDVLRLIKIMKQEVKNKFGVELKEEVEYLGF